MELSSVDFIHCCVPAAEVIKYFLSERSVNMGGCLFSQQSVSANAFNAKQSPIENQQQQQLN